MGCALTSPSIPTSIVWLPNATMFAVFLLTPPREWWVYALAVLPAHVAFAASERLPAATTALLFVTNLGDGALGALAVRRLAGRGPLLQDFRSAAIFVLVAIAAPLGVSLLDAGAMVATGWGRDYWLMWSTRSRSNVLTNLIWTPAIVLAAGSGLRWLKASRPERFFEAGMLALALTLAGVFAIADRAPGAGQAALSFCLPLAPLLWATFRFGPGATPASLLLLAAVLFWSTLRGHGPFAGQSPTANVIALQAYLTGLAALFLLLAALWKERATAGERARDRDIQVQGLFDTLSEAVLVTDHGQRIVGANAALCQLTGYDLPGLRALEPQDLFQIDDPRPLHAHLFGIGAAEEISTSGTGRRADGSLFRFGAQIRRFDYRGAPRLLSILREVKPRREVGSGPLDAGGGGLNLVEIFEAVRSTIEPRPLLRALLQQISVIVPYTHATICFHAKDGDVSLVEHQGPLSAAQLAQVRVSPTLAARRPILFPATPLIVNDLQAPAASGGPLRAALAETFAPILSFARALLMVPLKAGARPVGMLWIVRDDSARFTRRDAQLAWVLASQAAIALENGRLYEQAHESATFEERQRMARDLHDSVTQSLSAMAMMAEVLPGTWDHDRELGRRALSSLQQMIRAALAEIRSLLVDVHPKALLEVPLVDLLTQLADTLRGRRPVAVTLDIDPDLTLPASVHVVFFRVAQEALNNVAKHAGAAKVTVSLQPTSDGAFLSIRDDGAGFVETEPTFRQLGTRIMRERAASVGATLRIESALGLGTTVSLVWREQTGA